MSTGLLVAIEIGLIFGGAIAFALWEIRSVRKKR